jgi:DNA-binding GntR family transcriptional regulator
MIRSRMSTFLPSERKVVEKTSAALARTIRAAILDGRLEPDQPLPELDLAQQLGTSRTPIREALLLLEREGLVEAQPNRGATVRRYDEEQLRELYDIRAVLEGLAARIAAERVTERDIRRLEESCDRFAALRTSAELLADLAHENFVFHNAILEAAASERLARMVHEVTAVPLIYRSYMAYSPDNRLTVEREHRAITAALKEHDGPKAAELMQSHVEWARDVAIAHFPQAF